MPNRQTWIRKIALFAFAGVLFFGSTASAQDTLFGIPVPRVQRGNDSITITIGPNAPAIRVPTPPPIAAPQARPAAPPAPAPAPTAPPPFTVPPAPAAPAAPMAPAGEGGRVYGVFVGISDYATANDLPFCADDAHRVQRAFLNAGLVRPEDSIVLTDRAATRANVSNALARFNRTAGPNDTIVFFFSGHGNQIADRDGDEADGTDETIVLYDGAVTDDEMSSILSPGAARDFVALDSCYSGGFARDLARLPNSAGFYASREDQLSYVANEYQAGGYLSYFLAQNITRMGGRDIPMWELQRDLRTDFADSGANQRQELTVAVSRSVNTRTVLFDAPSERPVMVAAR